MSQEHEKANILLVDDQPQRLLSYEAILSSLGQNLIKAHSGTEALQRLMENDFAAILLDVNMPTMNGFDTAALIHQHPRFERTPIIFVTAVHVTDMDEMKGYELGAVDYCYVPIVPEILRGKVQVLVELYVQRRELERANVALEAAHELLKQEKTRELEELNRDLALTNSALAKTNEALQREITERMRFEEELREADRRKDEFLAVLSHELRNPLAAISNVTHLMKLIPSVDPQLDWGRNVLGRQAAHLTRLIDDLLDISRITRGQVTLRPETLDMRDVIHAAIETTRDMISVRRHALILHELDVPVMVLADRVRITQVIDNVLTNAAKYTPEDGRIEVALEIGERDGSEEAIVRVIDNGNGILADELPAIFQLFYRGALPHDRPEGGLGIGLALSRGLVEQHGGSITASSAGPGLGSEFVVRLPLHRHQHVAPTKPHLAAEEEADRVLRVLVIDDSVDSAESMAIMLRLSGHLVSVAYNGPDALSVARESKPDVALMDIGMPGMDGYEVARRVRADPLLHDMLLIAMTGYGREVDREQALAAGFDHHLVKPIDFDKLTELLARRGSALDSAPQASMTA